MALRHILRDAVDALRDAFDVLRDAVDALRDALDAQFSTRIEQLTRCSVIVTSKMVTLSIFINIQCQTSLLRTWLISTHFQLILLILAHFYSFYTLVLLIILLISIRFWTISTRFCVYQVSLT